MIKLRTALYDLEADGLNPSVIHCLVIQEAESDFEAVCDTPEKIEWGIRILEDADMTVAHNLIDYDGKVLRKLKKYAPKGKERDSFVMCQVLMGDIKETFDYRENDRKKARVKAGIVNPFEWKGKYMGSHSLEAWGYRLGMAKGDYAEMMKKKGLDPWASLNPDMLEYCRQDVRVLKALWLERILPLMRDGVPANNERAIAMEHFMQRQMSMLEQDGVRFNVQKALELVGVLEKRALELEEEIATDLGPRYEPKTWAKPILNSNNGNNVRSPFMREYPDQWIWHLRTDEELAKQGMSRELWGRHVDPAVLREDNKDKAWKKKHAHLPADQIPPRPNKIVVPMYEAGEGSNLFVGEGSYTPIIYKPVKVTSREQVARRLLELGWHPTIFTKTGLPVMSEPELQKLGETVPVAKKIALYYLVKKRLGQLKTGKQAWLRLVDENGYIHPRIRPCATITARAAHSNPNISQVPAIKMITVPNPDQVTDPAEVAKLENLIATLQAKDELTKEERKKVKVAKFLLSPTTEVVGWGEEGEWGADCRALFYVPDGWKQVGADLAGIELRAFANDLFPFDDGKFLKVLLEKDVHEENRKILGIPNRTDAKRFIFAWLYGAGDEMLGSIIFPTKNTTQQKIAGRDFRNALTSGIAGTAQLLRAIHRLIRQRKHAFVERQVSTTEDEATGVQVWRTTVGYLQALDGRLLGVRGMHSALNTRLQSSGAIVSKYWIYVVIKELEKRGWKRGYDGDYVFMIWSHDEVQFGCRAELAEELAAVCRDSASVAGNMLKMMVPIEADAKIGDNWQECH